MELRAGAILELLTAFEPDGVEEPRHLESIRHLLRSTSTPFSRSQFDPGHVTASAFIIDPTGSRLLLHHHRRLDRWLQMGGHVDEGELVIDAALREAREESGLDELALAGTMPFDLDVHAIPAGKGEPAHLHFDVRFVVRAARPESIRVAADESLDLRWFTFDEALEAMGSSESARAIGKLRRTAAGVS